MTPALRRVLVTGASGFIGQTLLPMLADRGYRIRAAGRSPVGGVEHVRVGDLGPETDWQTSLAGIDAVVHLAARVHVMDPENDPSAYRQANSEGTRKLAEDAAASGVRRFVLLSTAKVLGEASPPGRAFRDADAPQPVDPYATSKLEGEEALAGVAARSGMRSVVLRPPLVYGPGVGANFLRLMRAVDRGRPLPVGRIANRRSLVYVGNVASAIAMCLEHPDAPGRRLLVCDGEDLSTPELATRLALALGTRARLIGVPPALLRLAGTLLGRRAEVDRLLGDFAVKATGLSQDLGWRPRYTVDAGLRATAEWFRGRPLDGPR